MPFKLKLKKTRQYNVASKSLFVISVELLDGGVADCTLSVDSTGQECLDNVCQRQAITQPELFGLRYVNRTQQPRWVQLERPLKRQLEKYHYFLQLKNDLIEGRIICDCQQAVVLASYSRQAEYGNHDRERHTVEYLKNLLTFPKQMLDGGQIIDGSTLAETGRLEWLTEAVIQHHMALHNMSQAQAEEGFITTCQQLRGYGQEMFSARDQLNQSEVTIAISLTGIRVLTETSETPHFYRWMDITNVINHKRTFSIECQKQTGSASFNLASPEDGKYVWWSCVQQHTFYMKHQSALSEAPRDEHRPKFQEHGLSDSREELDARELGSVSRLEPLTSAHRAYSTSCLELADQHHLQHQPPPLHQSRALLPQYRPAPDYETAVQQKYQQQRAEAQLRYQNHHAGLAGAKPYGSHPDVQRGYPDVTRHTAPLAPLAPRAPLAPLAALTQPNTDDYPYGLKFMGTNYPFAVNPNVQTDLNQLHYVNVYKPPPPYPSNGLASNSTPDLAVASQALNYHRGYINSHVSGSSPDLVSTRTALNRQYLGYINTSHINYGRPNIMPGTHGTYNNLASVLDPKPHIIIDPHHISDNIQKVYDERGNIMYSMPMHRIPYQRHVVLPQSQQIKIGDTQEPIYENVPLPWQSEGKITMRDRAQSLTTTDEIARLNERNSSHPSINKYLSPNVNIGYAAVKPDSPDGHYVNAQIIKGVREGSAPPPAATRAPEPDVPARALERLALREADDTPYQSLSTPRALSNSKENVTSIVVGDSSHSTLESSTANSSMEADASKASSKDKKRRRWGVWMGRSKAEPRSATLGRSRAAPQPHTHRWSTGLPKFQPLPPSITKETMIQILERKLSDEQLSFAFEQLPKGRETGGSFRTALLAQHAPHNGFSTDHLPYDDNRLRLHPTPDNPHGYINASHITMTVGSTQRFYVLAKVANLPSGTAGGAAGVGGAGGGTCPCGGGCALLWAAAWQVGAALLARVAGPQLPHYLPPDNTTKDFGKFQVSSGSTSRTWWGASLRVTVRCGARRRALWHVHFAAWPAATATPHPHDFLAFLSEVNSLRLSCEAEAAGGGAGAPLLLSCELGAGRSGTALAADLLHDILDNNQELDIPRTISLLHQQRANMIQNVQQYKFLHQLLLQYLKQSRLI
ncbi:unnamed protein product [Chrysodeixis includens]|uniref:protein-tyrosine-phosphatase n=1 Tax=Chrysodeixis includens TaxID=689277 RepID=A0A9P0FTP7_CHRIL|nr:unnamed protein product [Chrysodeixis includens]